MLLIGSQIAVMGTWDQEDPPQGRTVIRLAPSFVYGTGYQPSTEAFLDDLEALPGATVVDYGTGSGILAIAYALRGAYKVLALDRSMEALRVAAINIEANRVGNRVELLQADFPREGPADLVLCNIGVWIVLERLIQASPRLLNYQGRLAVTYELTDEAAVLRTARDKDLTLVRSCRLIGDAVYTVFQKE